MDGFIRPPRVSELLELILIRIRIVGPQLAAFVFVCHDFRCNQFPLNKQITYGSCLRRDELKYDCARPWKIKCTSM